MSMSRLVSLAIGLLPVALLAGCATSYNCYPCGKVNCSYDPPKPLPYSTYDTCNCTDSIGQVYLSGSSVNHSLGLANQANTAGLSPVHSTKVKNSPNFGSSRRQW